MTLGALVISGHASDWIYICYLIRAFSTWIRALHRSAVSDVAKSPGEGATNSDASTRFPLSSVKRALREGDRDSVAALAIQ